MIEPIMQADNEGPSPIESFFQGRVDSLLESTHAQAQADVRQAEREQEQAESADVTAKA